LIEKKKDFFLSAVDFFLFLLADWDWHSPCLSSEIIFSLPLPSDFLRFSSVTLTIIRETFLHLAVLTWDLYVEVWS
jgi:hypothetical protein